MFKKILCLIIIAATMLTLVACEDNPNAQGCAHTLADWEVVLEPTCAAEGTRLRKCTTCFATVVVEPIERLAHTDLDQNCLCDGCGQKTHSFVDSVCEFCGTKPSDIYVFEDVDGSTDISTGDYIYLGEYPSTLVTDTGLQKSLLSKTQGYPSLENFKGWTDYGYYVSQKQKTFMWYVDATLSLDGQVKKYRGVYFIEYRPVYTACGTSAETTHQDDNGYTLKTLYWFEYTPIKWKVLESQNGTAMLLSEQIIDSQTFNYTIEPRQIDGTWYYTSNYAQSSIRKWLNKDFYNLAFTLEESLILQTVTVDNSARSTNPYDNPTYFNNGKNPYASKNTQDKVFMLSRSQATNPSYGFGAMQEADQARLKTGTDYAKAQGLYVYMGDNKAYYGTSHWWLRSAHHDYSSCVALVNSEETKNGGYLAGIADKYYYTHNTNIGVVPAIVIGV